MREIKIIGSEPPLHGKVYALRNAVKNGYRPSNFLAGPSGREVISLQKMDSLLVLVNVREAKKVSTT